MSNMAGPLFSVIVPTYQRPEQLAGFCLPALAGMHYPREKFEVIIVDDGSAKPPTEIVDRFKERLDIRLVIQSNQGPAVARNRGAASSAGTYLAFTDDDCAPHADWLRHLETALERNARRAVGGRTVNVLSANGYSAASQLLVDYLYGYYLERPGRGLFFTSNNLAIAAEQFHGVGRFDENFQLGGEDRELCVRLAHLGFDLHYEPRAVVYHAHRLSAASFIRQHFKYGRGAARFHRAVSLQNRKSVRVEPISFYLDLMRYPFTQPAASRKRLLCFLLLVSQAVNALGFFYEKLIARWRRRGFVA